MNSPKLNPKMLTVARESRGLNQAELAENPDEYAVVKLMPTVYGEVQKVVEEKLHIIAGV